jgi:hypothetical protein
MRDREIRKKNERRGKTRTMCIVRALLLLSLFHLNRHYTAYIKRMSEKKKRGKNIHRKIKAEGEANI